MRKASMVTPLVVVGFVILMILLFILLAIKSQDFDRVIGHNQFRLFNLYQEGAQAQFYLERSAPFALANALQALAGTGGFWHPTFEELTSNECGRFGGYNIYINEDQTCYPDQDDVNNKLPDVFKKELDVYLSAYTPVFTPIFMQADNFQPIITAEGPTVSVTGLTINQVIIRDGIQKIYQPGSPEFNQFLAGFQFPLKDFPPHDTGCLPTSDSVMPNALRSYRNGIHEGVDFYPGTFSSAECNALPVGHGRPVVAAKDGTIIRIDHEYDDLTQAEWDGILARALAHGNTLPDDLDTLRGRQVWIEHGEGIVTRYAHLDEVNSNLDEGDDVTQGQTVATVGNSGTPESITKPSAEMHLHFELRVGDSYAGAGKRPNEVRELYEAIFSPPGRDG